MPFKPSVIFIGHVQTVQNQIKRHRASGEVLQYFFTYYTLSGLTITTQKTSNLNGFFQLIREANSIVHRWGYYPKNKEEPQTRFDIAETL